MRLFLDTETIPSQDPTVKAAIDAAHAVSDELPEIKPAANLKDPDKIAADIAQRTDRAKANLASAKIEATADADEAFRKLSLAGATAHIACISFAVDDGDVIDVPCISAPDGVPNVENERYALRHFFDLLEGAMFPAHVEAGGLADDTWRNRFMGPVEPLRPGEIHMRSGEIRTLDTPRKDPIVVAHNAQFDIRMIWQRAVILGVTPPAWWPIDVRPWDRSRIIDTMTMWAGERDRVKLDALCKALGLPGKGSIDGSKVYDAILSGRLPEVVTYCGDDVRRLRCVHRRMTGLQPLAADIAALTRAVATEAA
jgi:hypothetical protein